jgi:hypothetical protein
MLNVIVLGPIVWYHKAVRQSDVLVHVFIKEARQPILLRNPNILASVNFKVLRSDPHIVDCDALQPSFWIRLVVPESSEACCIDHERSKLFKICDLAERLISLRVGGGCQLVAIRVKQADYWLRCEVFGGVKVDHEYGDDGYCEQHDVDDESHEVGVWVHAAVKLVLPEHLAVVEWFLARVLCQEAVEIIVDQRLLLVLLTLKIVPLVFASLHILAPDNAGSLLGLTILGSKKVQQGIPDPQEFEVTRDEVSGVVLLLVETHDVFEFASEERELFWVDGPEESALFKQLLKSGLRTKHKLLLDVLHFGPLRHFNDFWFGQFDDHCVAIGPVHVLYPFHFRDYPHNFIQNLPFK